ncbi:MAG: hypothetical protein LUC83_00135 [Clostridiales bacterium]|nr:hypothetical protein [Clostridiales bacterium]
MSRGNRHQEIYRNQSDYEFFLILLQDIEKLFSFKLHSYCLMTNHYHLLLEGDSLKFKHYEEDIKHEIREVDD